MMMINTASLESVTSLVLHTPYLPLLTSLLLCVLVVFWKRSIARGSILKSPPGPWKLPIIGSLHHMVGPLPHHTLKDLAKKHGPIMHLKLGLSEVTVISSREVSQEVLKTHELTFAQRPVVFAMEVMCFGQASMTFSPYGDFWRELRKICVSELLSTKRVQSFRSIREEEVWNLVEFISSISQQGLAFNFSEQCYSFTNGVIARAAFGKKCKDQKEFTSSLDESIKLAGGFNIHDMFPSLRFLAYLTGAVAAMKKVHNRIENILESIMNDHKMKRSKAFTADNDKAEDDDYVDVLLNLEESNKLTTNQVKGLILDMYGAASDPPATTLEWAMSELLRNPGVMEKAQAEVRKVLEGTNNVEETEVEKLEYLKYVVKETLRLRPPNPFLARQARERCEINGYEIPAKSTVLINEWALGRDQENWGDDAETFKPERFRGRPVDFLGFGFDFIPFGAGRRICPGMPFGIKMIELALSQLLYHFDWKLADGIKPDELDMTETFGATSRRKSDLYVIATPYFPSVTKTPRVV